MRICMRDAVTLKVYLSIHAIIAHVVDNTCTMYVYLHSLQQTDSHNIKVTVTSFELV